MRRGAGLEWADEECAEGCHLVGSEDAAQWLVRAARSWSGTCWPNDAHGRADPGLSTMIRILEGTIGWFAVPDVFGVGLAISSARTF